MGKDATHIQPERIAHELSKRGHAWADAEAQAQQLEQHRRPLRSTIATEWINDGYPANKAEMLAESDQRYRDHVDGMVAARCQADKAKVDYEAYRTYVELMRTQAATERETMRAY